jgi:hypothetical protein
MIHALVDRVKNIKIAAVELHSKNLSYTLLKQQSSVKYQGDTRILIFHLVYNLFFYLNPHLLFFVVFGVQRLCGKGFLLECNDSVIATVKLPFAR